MPGGTCAGGWRNAPSRAANSTHAPMGRFTLPKKRFWVGNPKIRKWRNAPRSNCSPPSFRKDQSLSAESDPSEGGAYAFKVSLESRCPRNKTTFPPWLSFSESPGRLRLLPQVHRLSTARVGLATLASSVTALSLSLGLSLSVTALALALPLSRLPLGTLLQAGLMSFFSLAFDARETKLTADGGFNAATDRKLQAALLHRLRLVAKPGKDPKSHHRHGKSRDHEGQQVNEKASHRCSKSCSDDHKDQHTVLDHASHIRRKRRK